MSPLVVSTSQTRWFQRLRSLPPVVSVVVILIGTVAILGWAFEVPGLTQIVQRSASIKVNAALCFGLSGIALGIEYWPINLKPRVTQAIALVCAIGMSLIAFLTLLQYGLSLNFGLDELLLEQPEPVGSTAPPGRMAPNTAIAFLLLGWALVFSKRQSANPKVAQLLALASGAIALMGLLGHLYGSSVHLWISGSYAGMAIHTAIVFLIINLGVLCDHPEYGLMHHISSNGTNGLVVRRLLPIGFIVPLLMGGLVIVGYRLNLLSTEAANALQVTLDIVVFTILIGWSIRDIARLDRQGRRVNEALRQSEERLQLAFEASGDGFWDWNIKTNEVYLSPRYFKMLGYDADALPQALSTWQNLVHPDDLPWVINVLDAHLKNSSVRYEFDYRLRTHSGRWKWIANYGKVVAWDETGKPIRMLGTHRDISDRKQAEMALQASEERWQLALKGNNDGIWDWNIQTNEVFFSTRWKQMIGYEDSELSNDVCEWSKRVHPDDRERIMQLTHDHLAQKIPFYSAEYQFQTKDNSYIWVLDRGQALWNESGQPIRMIGSHTDISDRKRVDTALRDSEAKFRSLSECSPLGIFLTDAQGQCTYINPRYQEITGDTTHHTLGLVWVDGLHPDDRVRVAQQWAIAVEHQPPTFCDTVRYLHQDRTIRYVKVYTSPMKTAGDTLLGYVGTLEDLTQQQATEQMKKDFISVVSHELRTPLTAIHGALGLLSSGVYDQKPEKRQAMLKIAANQTERLVRLVNDILELRRLESGTVTLDMQACDPASLIQQSVDGLQAHAVQHQITLEIDSTHAPVWAAPDAIIQTLMNLINNAIKFSPPNTTVLVSAERLDHQPALTKASGDRPWAMPCSAPSGYVVFKVQDCGRGIPQDKLDLIFEQFQQVDTSDSREKGGTGLGLTICRNIIQQHGGQIWVDSVLGEGSTFYFTLLLPSDDVQADGS